VLKPSFFDIIFRREVIDIRERMVFMLSIKRMTRMLLVIALSVATVVAFTPIMPWSNNANAASTSGSGTKADPYVLDGSAGTNSYSLARPTSTSASIYVQISNDSPFTVSFTATGADSLYLQDSSPEYVGLGKDKTLTAGSHKFYLSDLTAQTVSLSVKVTTATAGGGSDYTAAEELDFNSDWVAEKSDVAMASKSDVHWYKMVVPERMSMTYTPGGASAYDMTLYKSDGSTEIAGCYRTGGNGLDKLSLEAGTYYLKKLYQSGGTYSFKVTLKKYTVDSGVAYDADKAQAPVGGKEFKFTISKMANSTGDSIIDVKNLSIKYSKNISSADIYTTDGVTEIRGYTGEECGYGTVTLTDDNANGNTVAQIQIKITPPTYKKMYVSGFGGPKGLTLTLSDISKYANYYRVYMYSGGKWVSKGDFARKSDTTADNYFSIKGLKSGSTYQFKVSEVYKSGDTVLVGPSCEAYKACTGPGGKVKVTAVGGFKIHKKIEHTDPSNIFSPTFTTYSSTGYVKVSKVKGANKYLVKAESVDAESTSTKITGVVFKNARRSAAAAKGKKKIVVYAVKTTSDGATAYGPATAKTVTIK